MAVVRLFSFAVQFFLRTFEVAINHTAWTAFTP